MSTWKLLSEARGRLMWWWSGLSALIFGFVLLQMSGGKYAEIEGAIWLWLGIALLPGLLLLLVNMWLNRHPAKLIIPQAFNILMALSIGYLFTIVYVLVASQAAIQEQDISLLQYFRNTYYFLLPFNLVLMIGFWLFFYKKDNLFKPNPRIILDTASAKAAEATRKGQQTKARCYNLVATDKLTTAFEEMRAYFGAQNDQDRLNETIVQQGRHTTLTHDTERQLIEPEKAQIALNQIVMGMLNLIGDMKN